MKQSDIFTLILIAGIGTIVAYFACKTILGDPSEATVKFKKISQPVTSELITPDPELFNSAAINPTVEVYVGDCEDRDKNGYLDEDEVRWCECSQYDADQDSKISDEEYTICQNHLMGIPDPNPEEQPEGE